MARLTFPAVEHMDADQRRVYDATVAGRRGTAPANVMAWLRSPELADRAQQLGEFVRYSTTLPPRLSELAILVVARHWTSQYEWAVHRAEALEAGLAEGIIDDIAARRAPQCSEPDERAVYEFAAALMTRCQVPSGLYARAVAVIGEKGVVELVGLLGYYTLVAMTLNTFEIEPPPGSEPLSAAPPTGP